MTLRPYQLNGIEFLRENPRAFLADEMGLGKTVQLIHASEGKTLVVAPAMVLQGGTWRDEIAKWADDPSRFTTCAYTYLNDRRGREILRSPRAQFDQRWDTVILDEAHYIKGRDTSWTRLIKKMTKKTPRVYQASGTPIPNWAQELFSTVCLLNPDDAKPGGRLGSYMRWAEQWFEIEDDPWTAHKKIVAEMAACNDNCHLIKGSCEHYRAFFEANLGSKYMQRLRDDVLQDLPPLTEIIVETPMTRDQAREYRRMRDDMLAMREDGSVKVAWSESASHVQLDQMATSWDGHSGKFERLYFDLAQRTSPTLVVAHYQNTVTACRDIATSLGLDTLSVDGRTSSYQRADAVEQFKAGHLDVLVGSLETISEGLTLTAADMMIFVEKSWKPSRNQQAMRRIHRLGQTRPVTVLDYVTPDSIDAAKRLLLEQKTDHQMRCLCWGQVKALL